MCFERAHRMAYVKSDNNKKKHSWLLCCMKTNGVNITGRHRWHCVCESSLGSEKLWIHAGSLGAILDQSIWQFGRLYSGSCCLPYTPFLCAQHRAGQRKKKTGQNLPRLRRQVWHVFNVWSGHQRISEICLMEIHRVSLPTVNLSSLISWLVLPQLSMKKKDKIQSTDTHIHTHSQDTSDTHILTTPLSDCLSSPALVSLSLSHTQTQSGYHDTNCCAWWETDFLQVYKKTDWWRRVSVCLYAYVW